MLPAQAMRLALALAMLPAPPLALVAVLTLVSLYYAFQTAPWLTASSCNFPFHHSLGAGWPSLPWGGRSMCQPQVAL